MSDLNQVNLIGRLGADPDIRHMQSGDMVANLSVATSKKWKDRNSGEKREITQWHRVVIFGKLAGIVQQYMSKGSQVYISGELETRSWDQDGQKRYATEIVLRPYNGNLIMLNSPNSNSGQAATSHQPYNPEQPSAAYASQMDDLDDEIPF